MEDNLSIYSLFPNAVTSIVMLAVGSRLRMSWDV